MRTQRYAPRRIRHTSHWSGFYPARARARAPSRGRENNRENPSRPFDSRAHPLSHVRARTPHDYALASTMARVNIARALARARARTHMCARTSHLTVRVSLRVQAPLLHPSGYPAAGPSTATLGSPHKPTGYAAVTVVISLSVSLWLFLVVFLGMADRTRRSRACTHALRRYLVHTRERFPDSRIKLAAEDHLRFLPRRSIAKLKAAFTAKAATQATSATSGDHEGVRAH